MKYLSIRADCSKTLPKLSRSEKTHSSQSTFHLSNDAQEKKRLVKTRAGTGIFKSKILFSLHICFIVIHFKRRIPKAFNSCSRQAFAVKDQYQHL